MDERVDVPEITTACWGILGKDGLERESEPIHLHSREGVHLRLPLRSAGFPAIFASPVQNSKPRLERIVVAGQLG